MDLTILYRGPLSSCNYACEYCPFAKHRETVQELDGDAKALDRFVRWVDHCGTSGHRISVLFTPWGEALVRSWYQEALARLTNMPHVRKAAIQTNISCRLDWVRRCDRSKLGLWCTYHPSETTREKFLGKCRELDRLGIRYSVGMVGLREYVGEVQSMRQELNPDVYLWVNAYKRIENYYSTDDLHALADVDPLFHVNNVRHSSLGERCLAGESVVSIDGDGTIRRCHFIKHPIGNIYDPEWERCLRRSPCTNQTCGCHIGYVHMPKLGLYDVFGDGLLERIPRQPHRPHALPVIRSSADRPPSTGRSNSTCTTTSTPRKAGPFSPSVP
jgi:MoaA/NifB/PqqE/SkfB family radical SAM enzyme